MSSVTSLKRQPQSSRKIVCIRCARIKQACTGRLPCSRCKRLNVVCEPRVNDGSQLTEEAGPSSDIVKITRTHTGCLACRRRKKKCDEQRPKCFDCTRLCLDCTYPPFSRARKHSESSAVLTIAQALEDDTSELWEGDRSNDIIVDSELNILDDVVYASNWSGITESLFSVPSPRADWNNDNSNTSQRSSLSLSPIALGTTPDLEAKEDKILYNHYINVVARVLSRRDENQTNPYLSNIVPLAFSNTVVMDAVLALSANHWKNLQPDLWNRGVMHQSKALKALAKLLAVGEPTSIDIALCVTLLLCMIELFDGTSSHWKIHLDGARRLWFAIEQNKDLAQRSEHHVFYRSLYHYLDSATTISTCRPPLTESPEKPGTSPSDLSDTSSNSGFDTEEALYGIPKSLFHFLDKINSLAYQRKFRDDIIFEGVFRASATALTKELEEWSSANSLIERSADVAMSPVESAALQASIAYEQALHLRLHQVIYGYSFKHLKVKQCVQAILDAVQKIRYGSPLEGNLIFPLVLAGSSCDSESQRMIIRDRFLVMERTLGFQYIYTAHDLVKRVWDERDKAQDSNEEVNWAAIRYFQIPGLAFV